MDSRQTSRELRLRTALVIAIVSLLLTTVLFVEGSAYVSSRRSAKNLTDDVLGQATDRIDRVVRAQLDVAAAESAFLKERIDRGDVHPDDLDAIARNEIALLRSHRSLSSMSFGREVNGAMTESDRTHDDRLHVRFLRVRDTSLELTDFDAESTPWKLLRTEADKKANDPRTRPFYSAAKNASHGVWTETYAFFGEEGVLGAPGVTLATPVKNADGALLGVLTADFDLYATSRFLKDLDLFEHGAAFIVEYRADGRRVVIAHPSVELLAPSKTATANGLSAVMVDEIADPRVVAFAHSLPTTLAVPGAMTPVTFDVNGAPFVGGFRTLSGGDVHWVVCAFAPEEDVLGEVHKNDRNALAITIVATAFAILIALWIAATVARPLRKVAEETERVGRFLLEANDTEQTPILEVARVSSAVEKMKSNLRSFKKYVPSDVVRELVARGEEAKVGGKRATLTIHFSDIAGFTSIAETTSPEALVVMLSEYLDEMTKPILASGGTVDKFIGDAVMAFWGAPAADERHALHACEAALVNRDRLRVLNAAWEKEGRPRLDARAALHTGDVIVGNIGSRERLEYTVIGDSVNLASRLEGLNKKYGTSLMISEVTYALVKDVMVVRPLDRVSVKGKAVAVTVYELIGKKADVSEADVLRANRHATAFALYVERKFAEAATSFEALASETKDDLAADVLAKRSRAFVASPPGADWDGAEQMTTK